MERPAKRLARSATLEPPTPEPLDPSYTWDQIEENRALSDITQWNDFVFHPLPQDLSPSLFPNYPPTAPKRTHNNAFDDSDGSQELPAWVGLQFPDFFPTIPEFEPLVEDIDEQNPFAAENEFLEVHPALQRSKSVLHVPQAGVVNALIKFRFSSGTAKKKQPQVFPFRDHQRPKQIDPEPPREPGPLDVVPQLPPSFGDVSRFNSIDRELFKFYIRALCTGRTVVANENTYLKEIAPMIQKSDCLKHAVLSLSATYVLDYVRSPELEARANLHHKRALYLFSSELKNRANWAPGKEGPLIATITIFSHNEVVNWEIDRLSEANPRWYRGSRLAERILDASDPGYHFDSPRNVQATPARLQLANLICLDTVMSACVHPLHPTTSKCSYPWLLEGTELEQRKIVGFVGLSSKLMHYFAKITHLCGRLLKNPSSEIVPLVGKAIENKLENFWQWFDVPEPYETSDSILASCILDENGKVTTAQEVTRLIAESYVAAAQIYLQCRLFRRTREDPIVKRILQRLLLCIDWEPTSGPLFTAQTPLFSVFIAGIVSYEPLDREVIRNYFLPTISDSRGNILPCWRAIQHIWDWTDAREFSGISQKDCYDSMWEQVVAELSSKVGVISLS